MTAKTHEKVAVVTALSMVAGNLAPEQAVPFVAGSLAGGLLCDIDLKGSTISNWLPLTGKIITKLARHRGLFHSLFCLPLLFFALAKLSEPSSPLLYSLCLGITVGTVSHIFLDALFSKTQVFLPVYWKGVSLFHMEGDSRAYAKADKACYRLSTAAMYGLVLALFLQNYYPL